MQSDLAVRPWRPDDLDRLVRAGERLSPRSLHLRFLAGVPALPPVYLRAISVRWTRTWDAVVALDGDDLVGWAELGWTPDDPATADVAVCVIDDEQGHGIGAALLAAVTQRARASGVRQLHVDIAPDNVVARRAWRSATGSGRSTYPLAG